MEHELLILSAINGLAALLGIYFLLRAYRAYRRHGTRHLAILAVAVALLTAAILTEGFLVRVADMPFASAHIYEAAMSLAAFAVLVYSLHA